MEKQKQKINRSEFQSLKFKLENLINLTLVSRLQRIRGHRGGLGRGDMGWGR